MVTSLNRRRLMCPIVRQRTLLLFPSAWALQYAEGKNSRVMFLSEIDRQVGDRVRAGR
jgi:hypothetical protein